MKIDYDEQSRSWAEETKKSLEAAEAKEKELKQQLENIKT